MLNTCTTCRLMVEITQVMGEHTATVLCAKKGRQDVNLYASISCWMEMPKEPLPIIPGVPADETQYYVPDRTLLLAYRGSHSHGTYIKPDDPNALDDIDIIGVCIGPDRTYFGRPTNPFEQQEVFYKQYDSIVYEIRKMFELWLGSNPNVISLLFLRPEDYIYVDPIIKPVLAHPEIFLSEKACSSFLGYAKGQMENVLKGTGAKGYMGAKRKALFEKYGFDPKHAQHTIRILRNGLELVTTGRMQVYRTDDAEELIAIKTGKVPLTEIEALYNDLSIKVKEARNMCVLPPQPNYEKAEELLMSILKAKLAHAHHDCFYHGGRGCGNVNMSPKNGGANA